MCPPRGGSCERMCDMHSRQGVLAGQLLCSVVEVALDAHAVSDLPKHKDGKEARVVAHEQRPELRLHRRPPRPLSKLFANRRAEGAKEAVSIVWGRGDGSGNRPAQETNDEHYWVARYPILGGIGLASGNDRQLTPAAPRQRLDGLDAGASKTRPSCNALHGSMTSGKAQKLLLRTSSNMYQN